MKKQTYTYFIATLLTFFALLTLFLSSSVLFDWFGIRAKEGNYVPFVVWTNFICSFLYLYAVYGFLKNLKKAYIALAVSILLLLLAYIGLRIHINSGGLYESKTVGAVVFRIALTLLFIVLFYFKKEKT